LAALACTALEPSYRATTVLWVQRSTGPGVTVDTLAATHAAIALSDTVLRSALQDVPLDPRGGALIALKPKLLPNRLYEWIYGAPNAQDLRDNFNADLRTGHGIIKLSFRYRDSTEAAKLLNAVVRRYNEMLPQLWRWQDAGSTYDIQEKLLNNYRGASLDLSNFSEKTKLYSPDQKSNVLTQRAELSAALAHTRQELASRKAQLEIWPDELVKMKPLARILSQTDVLAKQRAEQRQADDPVVQNMYNTPPLILQNVYKESVQLVLQLRADVAGLQKQLEQQERDLNTLDQQLGAFNRSEPELNSLKLRVEQTYADAASFNKWLFQSRADAALSEAKILQPAYPSVTPIFPDWRIFVPFGAVVGFMLGVLIVVLSKEGRELLLHAFADEEMDAIPDAPLRAPVEFRTRRKDPPRPQADNGAKHTAALP